MRIIPKKIDRNRPFALKITPVADTLCFKYVYLSGLLLGGMLQQKKKGSE